MSELRKSLFSSFLIILFSLYVVDMAIFTHVHYVDGKVITHSHPNQGHHSHSCTECTWINGFSTLFSFEPLVAGIKAQQTCISHTYSTPYTISLIEADQFKVPDLRGPPYLKL